MMDSYNAIMRAADYIEAHPKEFDYTDGRVPRPDSADHAGACPVGWIGFFLGHPAMMRVTANCEKILGVGFWDGFVPRMESLSETASWRTCAFDCARLLRLYAERFHAPAALDPAYVKLRDSLEAPAVRETTEAL